MDFEEPDLIGALESGVAARVIDKETYLFDGEGRMLTGKQTVEWGNGEIHHYYFKKSGNACVNAIVDGSLYGMYCHRIDAREEKYELIGIEAPISVTDEDTGRQYFGPCRFIADGSGRLKKNGTVTIDGGRYTVKDYEAVGYEIE